MTKSNTSRGAVALALAAIAQAARAAGSESGTSAVGEMNVGVGTLLALIGGIAAMCVVLWLIVKVMNRKS